MIDACSIIEKRYRKSFVLGDEPNMIIDQQYRKCVIFIYVEEFSLPDPRHC